MVKPDPIELTVNLPPDGTYPPRIVEPGYSTWLPDNIEALEIIDGVFVQTTNGQCIIYQEHDRADIRVNNQIIIGRRMLKDGDFIHSQKKEIRAIFQADPVVDHRHAWAKVKDAELCITIQPSDRLANHVVINSEGISLNRGKNFARWDTIRSLRLSEAFGIQIDAPAAPRQIKILPLEYHYLALNNAERQTLLAWVLQTTPFWLSLMTSWEMDAYHNLVHSKIITPVKERKRDLPATPAFIFDLPSRRNIILRMTREIVLSIILSMIIVWILRKHIGFIILVLPFIYLAQLLSRWGWFRSDVHWLRHLSKWETLELPSGFFEADDTNGEKMQRIHYEGRS